MRVYSGDQLSFFFEVVSVFFRFFFFSFSSLPKKKMGGSSHPASRKAEALIKKLVPVQEMKPRASYPGWAYLFSRFSRFFLKGKKRERKEKREVSSEKKSLVQGSQVKKLGEEEKTPSQKLKTHSQKWMLEWLKTSQWRSRLWKHCFGVEPEGESVSRRGRGLG